MLLVSPSASMPLSSNFDKIIEQIEFVEEQIAKLDREIEVYMDSLQSPVTTLPGAGPM